MIFSKQITRSFFRVTTFVLFVDRSWNSFSYPPFVLNTGCDLLLASLRNNPKLCVLNLSSCRLSDRSAMSLSLFLKRRKADLLQNVWEQSSVQSRDENSVRKVRINFIVGGRNRKCILLLQYYNVHIN